MLFTEKGSGSLRFILDLKGNAKALCISSTLHAFTRLCEPSQRM